MLTQQRMAEETRTGSGTTPLPMVGKPVGAPASIRPRQVSVHSAPRRAPSPAGGGATPRVPLPHPGSKAFQPLGNPAGEGDSMLDELLGLDDPGDTPARGDGPAPSWANAAAGFPGGRTRSSVDSPSGGDGGCVGRPEAARGGVGVEGGGGEGGGGVYGTGHPGKHNQGSGAIGRGGARGRPLDDDSMLDELLGEEDDSAPDRAPNSISVAPGGPVGELPSHAAGGTGREFDGEGVRAAGAGEAGTAGRAARSPPFGGAELGRLCTHLNDRNRRAKRLSERCQEMFLRLYFKVRPAVVMFSRAGPEEFSLGFS